MKKTNAILLSILTVCCAIFISCDQDNSLRTAARQREVIVYAYDSFISEWGPAPAITEGFEAISGYTLTFVDCGDGAQILSRAITEKDNVQADVLLGLDNHLVDRVRSENVLIGYKPKSADSIINPRIEEAFGNDWILTPFDYSHFSIIYDTKSNVPAPTSLEDLTNPVYRRKLIIMDPRTSTPGIGFVAWTLARYGDNYADYWKRLLPSILTVAPSWSAGYGLFTSNEAPLVFSYLTSPAYHIEYDNTNRYQPLIFDEGHVLQVEGAGITKGAPNLEGAKAFIDYLISTEAQSTLPLTQWMYPINTSVKLPDSYKQLPSQPKKTLVPDNSKVDGSIQKIISVISGN